MIQIPQTSSPVTGPALDDALDRADIADQGSEPLDTSHAPTAVDPLAKFGALYGLHADVEQLAYPATNGGGTSGQVQSFAAGVVLAGAPLAAKAAPSPQKIGGSNPPTLQEGKSSGPIVADLQRQLNGWRETKWHAEGNSGWPPGRNPPDSGKFDAATREALKDFQRSMGLAPTGIADNVTQNLLNLENDPGYATNVSASNKELLRSLVAAAGTDGARVEALVNLLTNPAFASRLSKGDQALVAEALKRAKLDPAFAANIGKLLSSFAFKEDLLPDQRSAILNYIKNHPTAEMVDNVGKMLRSTPDVPIMLRLADKEWQKDHAGDKPVVPLGRNTASGPLLAATGPIPAAAWNDTTQIVGKMTQNATGVRGAYSNDRCGPTNLLAGALLQGPDVAAKYLDKAAANAGTHLVAGERQELKDIAARLRSHTSTFDDLSRAADLLYRAANQRISLAQWASENPSPPALSTTQQAQLTALLAQGPNFNATQLKQISDLLSVAMDRDVSVQIIDEPPYGKAVMVTYLPGGLPEHDGLDTGELRKAARAGGFTADGLAYNARGFDPAGAALDHLKPGESAVLQVTGDPAGNHADHFVTVGILKDGRPYIYNPDPAPGDATLTVGRATAPQPEAFTDELAKYSKRANQSAGDGVAATRISY